MLIDLNEAASLVRRQVDVCVIGAGAAGICLARRLLKRGREVVLLESGGTDYEAATADLNAGPNVGSEYYELDHARLRFFGGTTAIWGGRCAELDPIDLEKRHWVPHSGWPLELNELRHYYRQARPLFGLPSDPLDRDALQAAGIKLPNFEEDRLSVPLWTFDRQFNRFTFRSCSDLVRHPRCTIILHATATALEASDNGQVVRKIVAKSLAGKVLEVEAQTVVLASGGIENARLLLASRSVVPAGLGNENDLVGRFFMEHPHTRGGRLLDARAWPLLKAFGRGHQVQGQHVAALISPSPKLQRERQILNTSLTITARQPEGASQFWGMRLYSGLKHDMSPTRVGRALWMHSKKAANSAQRAADPLRPWLLHKLGLLDVSLLVRAEQAPNPDSRVMLAQDKDPLGMPRAKLDWRFSDLDKRSVATLVETVGAELKRLGYGSLESAGWLKEEGKQWQFDPLISSHPIGGYHHIGTTRMAANPKRGVVRADGRLHSVENLYVVGSSTFPTSSWANPTLTIVALALRTADLI